MNFSVLIFCAVLINTINIKQHHHAVAIASIFAFVSFVLRGRVLLHSLASLGLSTAASHFGESEQLLTQRMVIFGQCNPLRLL